MEPGGHGEPWVRQLPTGQYAATVYVRDQDGARRRISRTRNTARAARLAVLDGARQRSAGPTGTGGLTGATLFRDAAGMWLADREAQGTAATSIDHYRDRLSVILPVLGALRLSEITAGRVKIAFDRLAPGRAVSTLRAYRSVVSGVLHMAVAADAIPANPASNALGGRRHRPKIPRALTRAEWEALTTAVATDPTAPEWLADVVAFMLGTGVRIGEALGLRWLDVDVIDTANPHVSITGTLVRVRGRGLVRSTGKTLAAHRTIPIPDHVASMLRARMSGTTDASAVFCTPTGGWIDPTSAQRSMRKALDRAGFEWVTSHVFRKTAATILDAQGVSIREIADHLGHANVSMTQDVYLGRQQDSSAAAAALNRAWRTDHDDA